MFGSLSGGPTAPAVTPDHLHRFGAPLDPTPGNRRCTDGEPRAGQLTCTPIACPIPYVAAAASPPMRTCRPAARPTPRPVSSPPGPDEQRDERGEDQRGGEGR